jgi:hypothetical protein
MRIKKRLALCRFYPDHHCYPDHLGNLRCHYSTTLGRSVLDGISYGKSLILPVSTLTLLIIVFKPIIRPLTAIERSDFAENLEDINSSDFS